MQSSSSGLEAQLAEECTCSICMDIFEDPIQLPCQHTFCKKCLSLFAKSRNSATISCPMCNTVHSLRKPGDISQFPSDLFAKRIVAHLQAQRAAAMPSISPLSLDPQLAASASAPPMEEEVDRPRVLPNANGLTPSGPLPNAPPAELFDPPPKVPLQADPVASPSFWSRFFGPSSASPSSPSQEAQAAPSAPPEVTYDEPSLMSISSATNASTGTSSSFTSTNGASSMKSTAPPLNASSSAPVASSSASRSGPLPPPDLLATSSNENSSNRSNDGLGLSRAPHKSASRQVKAIGMPPGLMPPSSILFPECRPKLVTEESYMPFLVPEKELRMRFHKWKDTLWFARMEGAEFSGVTTVLCPAWRLDADITIKYKALASLRVHQKDKVVIERYTQKGQIRINGYAALFNAVDPSVPFSDILNLCKFSDQLPSAKSDQNLLTWFLGASSSQSHKLEDFPVPQGAVLDRSTDWYDQWLNHIKNTTSTDHPFNGHVTSQIHSQSGLRHAEVQISSIQIAGFHRLTLSPIRMPAYICNYTLPGESTPYHIVVNGQSGAIYDGGNRPMTGFGGFMRMMFRGAFK